MRVATIQQLTIWKPYHVLTVENEEVGHVEWTWMNLMVAGGSMKGTKYIIRGNIFAFSGFGSWTICRAVDGAEDVALLIATKQRIFHSTYTIRQSGDADFESGAALTTLLGNAPGTYLSLCPKKSLRCPVDCQETEVASFSCTRISWKLHGQAEFAESGVSDDLLVISTFLSTLQWRRRWHFIVVTVGAIFSITWNVTRLFLF